MSVRILILISILVIIISCAGNIPDKAVQNIASDTSTDIYLPGVDSLVARDAIQYSDRLIVDYKRRQAASLLYEQGLRVYQSADSLLKLMADTTIEEAALLKFLVTLNESNIDGINLTKLTENFDDAKIKDLCLKILSSANELILQSKHENPFDLNTRSLLIQILMKQGELAHDHIFFNRAIEELNTLLLVDKSNPYVYESLAECYYELEDWENCYKFFHKAEELLNILSNFSTGKAGEVSSVDTVRLVYYLRGQGEAKTKLYDAELAIHYLKRAYELTRSLETKKQLHSYMKWINWDEGNIRASEIKDRCEQLEKVGNYKKARNEYLYLLKILKTERAKNEVNWKIASIDYNYLNNKKEALQRLFRVVQNIQKRNIVSNLNELYLKDYAAMCYSIGVEFLAKHEFRLAYIFFNQASRFDWDHRANCYYHLAILSQANPGETIRNCNKALSYVDQLSEETIAKINELLMIAYRRSGEFELAERLYRNNEKKELSSKN